MKRAIIILVMLFPCVCSFGKTVSVDDAKTVSYHFLLKNGNAGLTNVTDMQLVYTAGDAQPCYYIFNAPHGFVIVSAEDGVNPVLGYSNEFAFDATAIQDNVGWLLNNYQKQITYVRTNQKSTTATVTQQWQALRDNNGKNSAQRTMRTSAVAPLLATTWNQDWGYNNYCPSDVSALYGYNGHVPTGCVATAMAQIMYYWKWPDYGTGSNSYASNYGTLTVDFAAATYTWSAMPVNSGSAATATLMFDAGVAVNMDYGPTGSSSELVGASPSAEYAFTNYFCYSSSIQGIQRAAFSDNDWINIIVSELLQPRPVIYSGDDGAGTEGHAWVVDGYDMQNGETYFHCNWGWGTANIGYFYMNTMDPSSSTTPFDSTQWVLTGITPNVPELVSMDSNEVCIGHTQTYMSGGTGGTWSSSSTGIATVSPAGIVTGIAPGTAIISYTASNACGTRSSTGKVTVLSSASSVNCDSLSAVAAVQSTDKTFEIYPNPGNGDFTIELPEAGDATILVMNLVGREVARQISHTQKTEFLLSSVSPGIYIVEVNIGNSIYRKMLVVR